MCCLPLPTSLGKAASRPSMRIRVMSTNCRDTRAARWKMHLFSRPELRRLKLPDTLYCGKLSNTLISGKIAGPSYCANSIQFLVSGLSCSVSADMADRVQQLYAWISFCVESLSTRGTLARCDSIVYLPLPVLVTMEAASTTILAFHRRSSLKNRQLLHRLLQAALKS